MSSATEEDRDVLFRVGVEAHPQTTAVLDKLADQVEDTQSRLVTATRRVADQCMAEMRRMREQAQGRRPPPIPPRRPQASTVAMSGQEQDVRRRMAATTAQQAVQTEQRRMPARPTASERPYGRSDVQTGAPTSTARPERRYPETDVRAGAPTSTARPAMETPRAGSSSTAVNQAREAQEEITRTTEEQQRRRDAIGAEATQRAADNANQRAEFQEQAATRATRALEAERQRRGEQGATATD